MSLLDTLATFRYARGLLDGGLILDSSNYIGSQIKISIYFVKVG